MAETVTKFDPPAPHHVLIQATNGDYLGSVDGTGLATYHHVDDKAVWDALPDGYRHVASGIELTAETSGGACRLRHGGVYLAADGSATDEGASFAPGHGPEKLPSEYRACSATTAGPR